MHPILIKLGPLTIHTYGFFLALGVLSAIFLSLYLGKKEKLDTQVLADFSFYTILIGLLGAKLFLFVTEWKYYTENPKQIPGLITSAGTFYGGLICGAIFVFWYVRKHKLNIRVIGDVMLPAVALAHFFGRMGCFMAGCCWGRVAENCAIAVTFTHPDTTTGVPHNIPLYPTQLLESILNLINFIVLMIFFNKKKFQGQIMAIYVFNYSLIRFIIEFFRGDDDRGYVFGGLSHPFTSLSVPQLISIIGIIMAITMYTVFRKKQNN